MFDERQLKIIEIALKVLSASLADYEPFFEVASVESPTHEEIEDLQKLIVR